MRNLAAAVASGALLARHCGTTGPKAAEASNLVCLCDEAKLELTNFNGLGLDRCGDFRLRNNVLEGCS